MQVIEMKWIYSKSAPPPRPNSGRKKRSPPRGVMGLAVEAIERLRRSWIERFRCSSSPLSLKRLSTIKIISRKVPALHGHPEKSWHSSNKFLEKAFYCISAGGWAEQVAVHSPCDLQQLRSPLQTQSHRGGMIGFYIKSHIF